MKELFGWFESNDDAQIQQALAHCETNPEAKKAAEDRYLTFIQVRLNDTNAGLESFAKAALKPEEQSTLSDKQYIGGDYLSFGMADDSECKLIVDVAGSMVKQHLNIDEFVAEAVKTTSKEEVVAFSRGKMDEVKEKISSELKASPEGWFKTAFASIFNMSPNKVMFDHTDFSDANTSPVLKEFIFFIGMQTSGTPYMDIFQSYPPNLTEVYWLLPSVPTAVWGDTEPEYPQSPLSYNRHAKSRSGDYGRWRTISSDKLKKQ